MMDDRLFSKLDELRRAFADYEMLSKKALGFTETITYSGILFNVRPDLVIADLSPLAFFNLVEYIDGDGVEVAAERLYERLLPLLSCRHRWTEAAELLDSNGKPIEYGLVHGFGRVFICKSCTACAIKTPGSDLPAVGRST